jgi:hypothetical protein
MENDINKFYNMQSDIIIQTVTTLLNYLKIYVVNAKKGENIFLNLLKETHQFAKLRSLIGLMIIVADQPGTDIWNNAEILVSEYVHEYFQDKDLYDLIKKSNTNKFFNYLLKNFEKKKTTKIIKDIDLIKENISKSVSIQELGKLLVLRHSYANELGYNTFLESIVANSTDILIVKKILDDLIIKINNKVSSEIIEIHKFYKERKLNKNDILHFYKFNLPQCTIKNLFTSLFNSAKEIFNLSFEEMQISPNNLILKKFVCKNTNVLTGYLYFGYVAREKLDGHLAINLEDHLNNGNLIPSNAIFLMNHKDWDTLIDFSEVQHIYSEFGYIIRYLIYQSNIGLLNLDNEYDRLYPNIMEFILWDTLDKLYNITGDEYVDLIKQKKSFTCILLQYECIDSIYDHLIHNSVKLIECIKNETSSAELLCELYKTIYKETFHNNKLIKYEINSFVIMNLINGMEGLLFSNITNRILAFSLYNYIKKNPKQSVSQDIFSNGVDSYRKLFKNFSNIYPNNYADFIDYLTSSPSSS